MTEIAYRDLQKRTREVRMREIRELRRSLRSDRDPRTSNMLKRLQRIYDRLLESERAGIDPVYKEVSVQANRLHQSCMELLRMSLRLWKASREVTTESVRKQLETSRESSINEVQEGIINLERSLDHLQTSELRGGASDEVNAARLRKELDEGLNVARRVENRIRSLDSELGDSSGEHRSEDFQDRRSD